MYVHLYICGVLMGVQPPRMLPCVLPHMLVQSLFEHKMWPTQLMPELHGAISEYWDHMGAHTSWGLQHPGRHSHEPVALYGDDAAVNKNGEKLFCVTLSHVLDPRKNSMCTLWPLCVFKCVTRLHWMFNWIHGRDVHVVLSAQLCLGGGFSCRPTWGSLSWLQDNSSCDGASFLALYGEWVAVVGVIFYGFLFTVLGPQLRL